MAEAAADGSSINVAHLIYKDTPYEGNSEDYEFCRDTMHEHWQTGLDDCRSSLTHRDWFDIPSRERGFVTHDVHRVDKKPRAKGGPASRRPMHV
ncbi:hypothetical protein J2W46_006893 [Paraburkholderia strydomiana]|nr:hypothetical protein [Paraburkholderia strydomiana]